MLEHKVHHSNLHWSLVISYFKIMGLILLVKPIINHSKIILPCNQYYECDIYSNYHVPIFPPTSVSHSLDVEALTLVLVKLKATN